MVQYCVVPGCKSSAFTPKISFHPFPKDRHLRKLWEVKIRRDDRANRKISQHMRVCSLHFREEDFREEILGKRRLKSDVVPSIFAFTSPTKLKTGRRMIAYQMKTVEDPVAELPPMAPEGDKNNTGETCESVSSEHHNLWMLSSICEVEQLKKELEETRARLANSERKRVVAESMAMTAEHQNAVKEKEIVRLRSQVENAALKAIQQKFSFSFVTTKKELMVYYTGFESVEAYFVFKKFCTISSNGISKVLSVDDELLLFLTKLRQGLEMFDLSNRFGISVKTVRAVFCHWLNIVYFRLGCLNIFPHRDIILKFTPPQFKKNFPATILILDATEVKIEVLSSLVLQSQSFSSYKSANTLKGLVGCDPKGGIIFVSQLFTGSMSDKQITQESGLYEVLRQKIDNGDIHLQDTVMADKGFCIRNEIESLGLKFNIPPMANTSQFSEEEVHFTRVIASPEFM